MSHRNGRNSLSQSTLDLRQATAHLNFAIEAFIAWLRCGLLPKAHANSGSWSKADLDDAISRLQLVGCGIDPKKKLAEQIPNIQRQPRTNTDGLKRYHYYRRGVKGALPCNPGHPKFMAALIKKERELATADSTARTTNRPPSPAQPTDQPAPDTQKSVMRKDEAVSFSKAPPLGPTLTSKVELLTTPKPTPSMPSAPPLFLTPEELYERWRGQVAIETLANWRSAGIGPPATRISSRAIFYRLDLLEAWEHQQLAPKPE